MEQVGEPIKGSKLVRDFCDVCREPIRVCCTHNPDGVRIRNLCSTCDHPPPNSPATPEDDGGPMWENVVRQLEDG